MKLAVFTKNLTNPAYGAARLGADLAAARFGAEAQHFVPRNGDDPVEQSLLIDEALGLRPDAFVLSPVHATRVDAALERIAAAGIPIISFVSPVSAVKCVSFVSSDDGQLARAIAEYLFARLPQTARVLIVSGPVDSVTSLRRLEGYQAAVSGRPGIQVAGIVAGDYLRETARERTAQWLAQHDTVLDGCLVANDIMAIGVLDALRVARRPCPVVGVNAIPQAIEAIREGAMLATADFNAMRIAFLATECAVRHLQGSAVPATVQLPVQIVDSSNCELWDKPYEQRTVLTLDELSFTP